MSLQANGLQFCMENTIIIYQKLRKRLTAVVSNYSLQVISALFFILICVCLFPGSASAQWHNFLTVNTDDGLSHNNVKAIVRDNLGFIWIGTKSGLDRFDGFSLRNYNCIDSVAGRSDNNIGALYDDGKYLWIGTDNGVFKYDKRSEKFHFVDLKTDKGETMDNWVAQITGDSSGSVWIIVPNQGVFFIKDGILNKVRDNEGSLMNPSCMNIDSNGTVWIGSWGQGLFFKGKKDKNFKTLTHDRSRKNLKELGITSITNIGNNLYISTQTGQLYCLNTKNLTAEQIEFGNPTGNVIRTLSNDGKNIYVGTYEGLFVIDSTNKKTTQLRHDATNTSSICDDIIFSIYNDNYGNLWAGTLFGGLSYYSADNIDFQKYYSSGGTSPRLSSDHIRGLDFDSDGNLWIGTEGAGLNRISPDGTVAGIGKHNSTIFRISHFGDTTYCGTYSDGMLAISKNGNVRHFSPDELDIEDPNVFAFYKDKEGNFWIGNGKGAWKATAGTKKFQKIKELSDIWIHDIKQDRDGNMWFASNGGGIRKIDHEGKFHKYLASDIHSGLKSNIVTSIYVDSKNRTWFSTDNGGLALYNKKTDDFTTYSKEQGLPDNVVYDILEDDNGNLWFGTNKGIVCFNPDNGAVKTYNKSHGLRGNQFNYSSVAKDSKGNLYFGGQAGLISFSPKQVNDTTSSNLYFSRLSIGGKEVIPNDDSILSESILFTSALTIPEKESNISLQLSMPIYWGGKSTTFYYRLEPLDKEWRKVNGNTINFAGLASGDYTLMVRGETSDGKEAYKQLSLRITPPWYASWWAYVIYALLLLAACGFIVFLYKRRKERQFRHLQRMIDMENEKEIYESKLGFFTEVAHEIRTPVTLISAPLESIKEMQISNPDLKYNIGIIEANTSRLLTLISQILDLEKVGREKYVLSCKCQNVGEIVKETAARFERAFERAGQKFSVNISDKPLFANVDKDAIIKIISNLLNNALKYGEHTTTVSLDLVGGTIIMRISNDGNLIPHDMRERIFQPFVRGESTRFIKPGSGIGLGLAKALSTLQGGKLYIDETDTDKNTFVVELPECEISEDACPPEDNKVLKAEMPTDEQTLPSGRLLVVEDNDEIREFLCNRLRAYFKIASARDGGEALSMLRKENFDLVLTDLMMPEMNGYELCSAIKNDISLSHIPVIILTAKSDTDSKLSGLRCGAEAFIEKPFNFTVLKEQISTLVRNRQKEREAFNRTPYLSITPSEEGSEADKEFNAKLMKIIEENIADEDLNVEKLADILCMSRSALFRKLKQQFGQSPVVFLRTIRLKKGAELIATGKFRIAEIGPMVGISSASYFNSQFQKQFGMTPKEYEHQCRIRQESSEKD